MAGSVNVPGEHASGGEDEDRRPYRLAPPHLLLPIGLPGSGKTTLARVLVSKGVLDQRDIVSTDALRASHGWRHDTQPHDDAIFDHAEGLVLGAATSGQTAYLDATNLFRDRRQRLIAAAQAASIPVLLIEMTCPPHECRKRNSARLRPIPPHVMDELERYWTDYLTVRHSGSTTTDNELLAMLG